MSKSKRNEDELYQEYLAKVYRDTSGYLTYPPEQKEFFTKTNVCTTYGELLYPGVKKMISEMNLQPTDVFLDLGSGLGKCALQIFMQTNLPKVIGVEASQALVDQAHKVLKQVKSDFPLFWDNNRELNLMCDNFLHADWDGATIVYTCSTSFTDELLQGIAKKINAHPKIEQVLSMRAISNLNLPLKKVIQVECSWDTSQINVYSNRT